MTLTVGKGMIVKLAVMLLLEFMVRETGLVELVILPVQLLNLYPVLAVAVTATVDPSMYVELLGFFEIDPLVAEVVRV